MTKHLNFGEVLPKKQSSGKFKEIIAKLSRGLMLPIAMLPIAGLALGIGATINSQAATISGQTIGSVLMLTGNIIFAILPLLFAIAVSITFTKDSGTAALSSVVGYFVFLLLQTALIIHPKGNDPNYHFLWYNFTPERFSAIFIENFGVETLSTSVFGGILVGVVVAWLYNKFKNIQLHYIIGFFSGVRFIPIVTFGTMIVFSMLFAIVWPLIGQGLFYLGEGLQYGGQYGGVNSLIYGIVNRALVPFGMHHVVNTMLWFTNIGGQFDTSVHIWSNGHDYGAAYLIAGDTTPSKITGDINMQVYFTRLIGAHTSLIDSTKGTITIQNIMDSAKQTNNPIAPGQYTNFAYVFGLFGLSGSALGMLFAAPKGDGRKQAAAIVIPGAIVSSLTGVSEAIEFTFLFLAPWLFWGFHALLAGIGGMITTTLIYYAPGIAPHVTFSFAQGALDFVIYGVIPDVRGGGTHCWMLLLMSIMYFPIYFGIFYWAIRKWNLQTPGRGGTKLFTKADWVKEKAQKNAPANKALALREKSKEVITAYGGKNNILNIDACITKLRIQVKDKKIVNEKKLKELGALGVTHPSPQSVYAVFGSEADLIKNQMKDIIAKGESEEIDGQTQHIKH
ncbi:MAG: PTS transporter subunit EIIC [Mycoplasmataceae bacterium]|nr:PTS transporter subunit EIIC [Mycoplasmataceae bacterium]